MPPRQVAHAVAAAVWVVVVSAAAMGLACVADAVIAAVHHDAVEVVTVHQPPFVNGVHEHTAASLGNVAVVVVAVVGC